MNTPTCATCQYYRPYAGKSYVCSILHEMRLYSHVYPSDPACPLYQPHPDLQSKPEI